MRAAHSDLHPVALLCLLFLSVPVPQLGLRLLQAPLGDFPEGPDLVPLQLEVAPLLPLSVQLLSEANYMLLQLEIQRFVSVCWQVSCTVSIHHNMAAQYIEQYQTIELAF